MGHPRCPARLPWYLGRLRTPRFSCHTSLGYCRTPLVSCNTAPRYLIRRPPSAPHRQRRVSRAAAPEHRPAGHAHRRTSPEASAMARAHGSADALCASRRDPRLNCRRCTAQLGRGMARRFQPKHTGRLPPHLSRPFALSGDAAAHPARHPCCSLLPAPAMRRSDGASQRRSSSPRLVASRIKRPPAPRRNRAANKQKRRPCDVLTSKIAHDRARRMVGGPPPMAPREMPRRRPATTPPPRWPPPSPRGRARGA